MLTGRGGKKKSKKNGSRDASDVTKGTEVRAEKIQSKTGGVKIQNKERTKMVLVSLQSFFLFTVIPTFSSTYPSEQLV